MNDEEYIHMKLNEREEQAEKPEYQLRDSDFIPFVGLYKHVSRCVNNPKEHADEEEYQTQCWLREMALTGYNAGLVMGTLLGAAGLAALLAK